jgi:hypothetical protein
MIVSEDRALINDKTFVGVLVFGIFCAVLACFVGDIFTFIDPNSAYCIDNSFCSFTGRPQVCFEHGYTYCCTSSYDSGSCRNHQNSCEMYGDYK